MDKVLWDSPIWQSLLSESQYAVELTQLGLRRLCQVPTPDQTLFDDSSGSRFALHVGMHSFSSGLERLCKLAISCHAYCTHGQFPNLKSYSHGISKLVGALEELDFRQFSTSRNDYLEPPAEPLDPELTSLLDRFSQGSGRYEYLDSLASSDPVVDMFDAWCKLCARSSLEPEIGRLLALRDAIPNAILAGCEAAGAELETLIMPWLDGELGEPMFRPSVAVAMTLHRKARWAAACLSTASSHSFWVQRTGVVPLLSEVVGPGLVLPSSLFFECHIARLGDAEIIEETVVELLKPGYDDFDGPEDEFGEP